MVLALFAIALFSLIFVAYAIAMRRRDTAARRSWEAYCNEQALANDATHAARLNARRED